MVTRKSVPQVATAGAPAPLGSNPVQAQPTPPYPTSPLAPSAKNDQEQAGGTNTADSTKASDFEIINKDDAYSRPRSDSDASHGTWDDSDEEENGVRNEADIPQPLRITPSKQNMREQETDQPKAKEDLPAILRPGPANGIARKPVTPPQPKEDAHSNPWANAPKPIVTQSTGNGSLESNNPFRQQNPSEPQSSQAAWEETRIPAPSAPPPVPPVELPAVQTPADELSQLSLGSRPFHTAEVLHVPSANHGADQTQTFSSSNPWQNELSSQPPPPPKDPLTPIEPSYPPPPPGPPPTQASLIDQEEPSSRPHPGPISIPPTSPLPSGSVPETPRTQAQRQRNEHYQIKHVNWYDGMSNQPGMRRSPILTQNANGPCPLLALVNALVLSTPPTQHTALVETLQTREQVSLGLLLDAVFDELMSGRRGDTAQELPDVSELYAFLLALHTGMNVNPRFVEPLEPPTGRAHTSYGRFEETREMRLYSTFNVPLLHGWTTPKGTATYIAFERSAPTFEDAQNIQFAEMELEDKLRAEGLSGQEQQTLQDIQTIKAFLNTWPTQLTDSGLTSIAGSLSPGQIAILFRNDHFSTVYKEPKRGTVMTLVTDAGYGSHEEIVWESLVDVNGAASEMFSGDFRVVSHNQGSQPAQSTSNNVPGEWYDAPSHTTNHSQQPQNTWNLNAHPGSSNMQSHARPASPPTASTSANELGIDSDEVRTTSEQEDHDLALALQLQEEEEEHHRQEQERRRREQELSEQLLETEGERPPIPPRRNQAGRGGRVSSGTPNPRPPVNRPANSDPDAPPTYEQAASDRPYRPAGATAPATQGNPLNAYDQLRRQQNANAQSQMNMNMNSSTRPGRGGRRRSSLMAQQQQHQQQGQYGQHPGAYPGRVQGAANLKDADERCVVM